MGDAPRTMKEERTDPQPAAPPASEPGPNRLVDTLAEAQALAALDEMLAKVDSVGSEPASAPAGEEPPREPYARTGDVPPLDGWYVALKDDPEGPLTVDQLQERWSRGEIGADTLCWREGMDAWRPLSRLHGLTAAIAPRPPREGLKALSARPPTYRPSKPHFAPSASSMLRSLAEEETKAERPRPPPRPSGPQAPPAVKPAPPPPEPRAIEADEEEPPAPPVGVSGARLFLSLLAASLLGGVVGGWVVKQSIPPPAPVVVAAPAPVPPPPAAAPVAAPTPRSAPPAAEPVSPAVAPPPAPSAAPAPAQAAPPEPAKAAAPKPKPDPEAPRPPPAPKKPETPKTPVDKEFQDAFGG